jgi:hypothetical protein
MKEKSDSKSGLLSTTSAQPGRPKTLSLEDIHPYRKQKGIFPRHKYNLSIISMTWIQNLSLQFVDEELYFLPRRCLV